MGMSDYERYQLEWMIDHGYSLRDFVKALDVVDLDGLHSLEDAFDIWEFDYGFGGELYACEAEYNDTESNA